MNATIRVATLNIWHDRGPWPRRLPLIRQELLRCQPDVIGLQEVLRERGTAAPGPETCQAMAIADGLGYTVAYAPAARFGGTFHHGNAVLSRYPILAEQVVPLPGGTDTEPRCLLYTLIDTAHGRLPVFVTHLDWQPHHAAVRLVQAGFVAAEMARLAPTGSAFPAVLLGDLNAEPHSAELRYLLESTVDGHRFVDAWARGGDGSAGHTFDPANDYARAAGEPGGRIDYILVREPAAGSLHTELAFTAPDRTGDDTVWPSDHFGLFTDIAPARAE